MPECRGLVGRHGGCDGIVAGPRTTFGRSYPGNFPVIEAKEANLTAPIEFDVTAPGPENWIEVDLQDKNIYLLPTQHYMIVYEHLDFGPFLAIEAVADGDWSHGLIIVPDQFEPYGVEGNFRMQLTGQYFCTWKPEDLWFAEIADTAFLESQSARAMVRDIDVDGHEDLVLLPDKPEVYLGDGKLGFAKAPWAPFPEDTHPAMLVFGDLDNDGDPDAFAPTWIGWDNDNDMKYIVNGDCNDADGAIFPGAEEVPDNGIDDDCDLDLIIADRWGAQRVQLSENKVGQENNWVKLSLVGTKTNRDAVGARVVLKSGEVTQMREVIGSLPGSRAGASMPKASARSAPWYPGPSPSIDSVSLPSRQGQLPPSWRRRPQLGSSAPSQRAHSFAELALRLEQGVATFGLKRNMP